MFVGYVVAVFAALPFARDLVLALRSTNVLSAAVTAIYAVSVALVAYHVVFDLRSSDWLAFSVLVLLIGVITALLLGPAPASTLGSPRSALEPRRSLLAWEREGPMASRRRRLFQWCAPAR